MHCLIKLRLAHRDLGTVLIPELVAFAIDDDWMWAQPQFFYAPLLQLDDVGECWLRVALVDPEHDQADGLECGIRFGEDALVGTAADGSQTYGGEIELVGPLQAAAVGQARLDANGLIDVLLHHHTTPERREMIQDSREIWGSEWNFQGTRRLQNVRYAYFTALRRIADEGDLRRIAMSSAEYIALRLDTSPDGADPDLVLPVRRESTANREATKSLWVPSENIALSHIYLHQGHPTVYYENVHPWIQRVGLEVGNVMRFDDERDATPPAALRRFDYVVLGDCTTLDGLEAPYDEENTQHTFALVDLNGTNVFEYWRRHANQALYGPPEDPQQAGPWEDPR